MKLFKWLLEKMRPAKKVEVCEHLPLFSKRSELYWFGMPCTCCKCGQVLECPEGE